MNKEWTKKIVLIFVRLWHWLWWLPLRMLRLLKHFVKGSLFWLEDAPKAFTSYQHIGFWLWELICYVADLLGVVEYRDSLTGGGPLGG